MLEIIKDLSLKLKNLESHNIIELEMKSSDEIDYKSLVDIAQIYYCKLLTPRVIDDNYINIRFKKLDINNTFHKERDDIEQKYGSKSIFSTINKNNYPSFLIHYLKALENVTVDSRIRILNLGVNNGEEFTVIKQFSQNFGKLELIGVDYCLSAMQKAKENFDDDNITFLEGDINNLEKLNLGKFDLIITIGTLQSSNLDFNKIFMNIVQNYLKKDGAMILGFPNCRWIDGEMIYGAKAKNYNFSEMSVLYKDVNFCKKYLQQKKFRVTITGKDYIFLTATSIRK